MLTKGLSATEAKVVGELYVGDMIVPKKRYQDNGLGLEPANIFRYSDIIGLY